MSKPNLGRIKPPPFKFRNKNINEKKIVSDYSASLQPPTLKFSFRFLDFNDPSFQINDCDSAWFIQLFVHCSYLWLVDKHQRHNLN